MSSNSRTLDRIISYYVHTKLVGSICRSRGLANYYMIFYKKYVLSFLDILILLKYMIIIVL